MNPQGVGPHFLLLLENTECLQTGYNIVGCKASAVSMRVSVRCYSTACVCFTHSSVINLWSFVVMVAYGMAVCVSGQGVGPCYDGSHIVLLAP